MKNNKKRDTIIILIVIAILAAVPIYFINKYNNQVKADEQAIANNRTEMRNLRKKRKEKIAKMYERKQNIKQLNQRLHNDTNLLLQSQRVLLEEQRHKVDPIKADKADTNMAKLTTSTMTLSNGLIFNYGKEPLTISASYPSKFKVGQDTINIIIHAYNKHDQEIAFAVLYYDPNGHVFNRVDNYSVSRQTEHKQAKGDGTDYQSYLRRKRAAAKRKAEEKAQKEQEQAKAQKAKAHDKSKHKKGK